MPRNLQLARTLGLRAVPVARAENQRIYLTCTDVGFVDGCGLGRYGSYRLRDGRDRGVVGWRQGCSPMTSWSGCGLFPDIGRDELIRFFTLTSPCSVRCQPALAGA